MQEKSISIIGAKTHNLKNLTFDIPREKLIVFTGVSGSGKSSLVFDTIYAEGQRRYMESLSSYARQFLNRMNKADVESITGICPSVAIEQNTPSRNPRSTVATTTEIYDYIRLLFARIGKTICFSCGNQVKKDTVTTVINWLENRVSSEKYYLAFPLHLHKDFDFQFELELLRRKGFFRVWQDGNIWDLNDKPSLTEENKLFVVVDRFKIETNLRERLSDSIEAAFKEGEGRITIINPENSEIKDFSNLFECCGIAYEEPEPRFFSFNNPFGACPVCQGFGKTMGYDMDLIVPNPELSIINGAISPWRGKIFSIHQRDLIRKAKNRRIPTEIPWRELSSSQINLIENGFDDFIGINKFFQILEEITYKMHIRIMLSKYRGYHKCSACKGSRLRREAMQVEVGNLSIDKIVSMTLENAKTFFDSIQLSEYEEKVAGQILEEIKKRLIFLYEVGLGYLTLDRLSSTLSGGESQRINLATSLGSALVGTLYVLDEPSIGLHPSDNEKLIKIMKSLRDLGNTVIVVEHDPEIMKSSDYIFDMGPLAGANGGEIIARGTYSELMNDDNSLTGKYLSGKEKIPIPTQRRTEKTIQLEIKNARMNNIRNLNIEIPLNKMVVVSGISGSGKSTLVNEILAKNLEHLFAGNFSSISNCDEIMGWKNIDAIEIVDQSPIGKSPRSNPISYVKGFDLIRDLFSSTHISKARGYKPGAFSFNVDGGRCDSCKGDGFVKIEMQFLADLYLECEDCGGTRFKKEIRDVTYKGKNIVEVLEMTTDQACEIFSENSKIMKYLTALQDVGLGYIKLGQPSNTLSGGEAQRVKLASHLANQNSKNRTLFLFDEPTTGLHFHDIQKLIDSFEMLLKKNNSILIIEHNLEIIKVADFIIDMGPGAGINGGKVVAVGTPEQLAVNENSVTGKFLNPILFG